jgi:hypothetical protein
MQAEGKLSDLETLKLNKRIDAENALNAVVQHRIDIEQKADAATKLYQDRMTSVQERQNALQLGKENAGDKFIRIKYAADNFAVGSREDIVRQAELQTLADEAKAAAMDKVDAIRDQIDPLRATKREQEEIASLVKAKLIDEKEVNNLYAQRAYKTAIGLSSRIPQSMVVGQGVLSSGLMVGSASPKELIDINRQILEGIRSLVRMEAMASKGYN